MTTEEFVQRVSERLNGQLDMPILNEAQEYALISFIVQKVAVLIPDVLMEFFVDASDGLSMEEADRHAAVFAGMVCRHIDVPWVPMQMERMVIEQIINQVFALALQGEAV